MKFRDLQSNDQFYLPDYPDIFIKCDHVGASCCTPEHNAKYRKNNNRIELMLINGDQDIIKIIKIVYTFALDFLQSKNYRQQILALPNPPKPYSNAKISPVRQVRYEEEQKRIVEHKTNGVPFGDKFR